MSLVTSVDEGGSNRLYGLPWGTVRMKQIFLSFHFSTRPDHPDRILADQVRDLLLSHGITPVTGEQLGGQALTPAVMKKIEASDGLIALCTRRERIKDSDQWITHPWVEDEFNHACSLEIRAIRLLQASVANSGAYSSRQYIEYDPNDAVQALLKLSKTIGDWKYEAGRPLKIQLLLQPQAKAARFSDGDDSYRWEYRFYRNGKPTGWAKAGLVPEPGGLFLYLEGVRDDDLIQVQLSAPRQFQRTSKATPMWLPIELHL